MPKVKISEYSATANSNTDVASINIDEGCAPSGINNAIRAIMGHLKDFQSGTSNDPFTIGSSGSLTLSYGTANGVAYLNGSKVLTTGSALTFSGSALAVTGSISSTGGFTSNTTITAQLDGSDSAGAGPGLNLFNTAFTRGWRTQLSASNNKVDYYFNGAAYVAATTIDTSGNLGLGVTPSAWISVYKGLQINEAFFGSQNNAQVAHVQTNTFVNSAGDYKYIATNYASRYRQFNGQHEWYNAPSGTAGNTVTFTQAMTLDASGNLAIGSTSANARLHVYGANTASAYAQTALIQENIYPNSAFPSMAFQTWAGGNAYKSAVGGNGTDLCFYTSSTYGVDPTERARIDGSGKLLVGATSTTPYFDGVINAFNSIYPGVCAKNGTAATFTAVLWNTATSGDNKFMTFGTEGSYTERGTIDYNRGGGITRYNTTSDATLKNIIGDADSQRSLEILSTTRIREYAWKDDEAQKPQIGVIAQELYETYKGAVSVGGDVQKTDEEGNVVTEYKSWGVDKTAFTFHLIKGWQEHERIIQEQQALITQLTARITALESA